MTGTIVNVVGSKEREATVQNTWGHLMPKGNYYKGTISMYHTAFRVSGVFDFNIPGIESSPWFFDALTEFNCRDDVNEHLEDGCITVINVQVWAKKGYKFTIKPGKAVKHKFS